MTKPDVLPDTPERSSRSLGVGLRWWIVWTLFGSTAINYISRQTFSVLAPMITAQFHLSHTNLARIFGAFQVSCAVTWLLGGIFLDVADTRIGLAIAVVLWSAVNAATGLVNSVAGFAACRFLLGVGEGFNWPGASKTVASGSR
jgi:ACS family hexuronate transporter-like MFS transporter